MLGSLPGDASLAARQYYAHPRNQFWRLIGAVLDQPDLHAQDYARRTELLTARGLALWDVLATATRAGSLDAAIRQAEAAPLSDFVATLPGLRAVAFNGGKSSAVGRRALAGTNLALIDLPSSSPAHAALSFERKRERWLAIKDFLA